jgi:HAD superfamily phosphoserine phosphatase-like hydrolase
MVVNAPSVLNSKVVIFDLDGTLITGIEYIYSHLWEYFDVPVEKHKKPVLDYLHKRIDYAQWVREDIRLLQEAGADKETMIKAFGELKLIDGAMETITAVKDAGRKLVLISGSIELALRTVIPDYEEHFDDVFINHYFFDGNGSISHAIPTPYDMEHKAKGVTDMAKKYGCTTSECIFIGDSENDIHAAEIAGFSIAFNCKSEMLGEICDVVIKNHCIKEILPYIIKEEL